MAEAWPSFRNLTSPYKKTSPTPDTSGPPISPEAIQQIADNMDKLPPTPMSVGGKCQQLMNSIPEQDLSHLSPHQPGQPNQQPSELEKLLKVGYKPLEKIEGKWSETSAGQGKLILEDQK